MTKVRLCLLLILVIISGGIGAIASENDEEDTALQQLVRQSEEYEAKRIQREIERLTLSTEFSKALLELRKFEMQHRAKVFWWQHVFGIAVFILVIILVLGGLYLSYLQFKRDGSTGASSQASIEIGREGLKFSSSVIGLAILFMSFGFFYLYIERVYTIQELTDRKGSSDFKVPTEPSPSATP